MRAQRTGMFLAAASGLVLGAFLASGAEERAGTSREKTLRSWETTMKEGGGSVARRAETTVDYATGEALTRYTGADDRMWKTEPAPAPSPSRDEIEAAIAVVRGDADLARHLTAPGVTVDGGFILTEPAGKACGPGSRCLQIYAFPASAELPIFRAVVDMTKSRIVYRNFWPTRI